MKKIVNFYCLLILFSIVAPKVSMAQCDNPPEYLPSALVMNIGNFTACPRSLPALGSGYACIGINGIDVLCYQGLNIKTFPNLHQVIYWPKGTPMNWGINRYTSGPPGYYTFCNQSNDYYFQRGGTNPYQSSTPQVFQANEVGFYQLGGYVTIKEARPELVNINPVKWLPPIYVIKYSSCPNNPFNSFAGEVNINVCVVDCGGSGTITLQPCGDNILHRPENTAEYEYFWQGMQCGTDASNGDPTYPVTSTGTYYLRGRHKATLTWGSCISIYAVYNAGPVLATPPVPTVNGNTCGDVTLTMPVTPGVTYYWQGEGCVEPPRTDKSAATPYVVEKPGTYYVRAYNGSCWSACSAVTPTINAIAPPLVKSTYACDCENINPATGRPDVTVTATPSAPANTCNWYTHIPFPPYFALLGTGLSHTFNINQNATFFVTSYNSSTQCESAKVPVNIKFKSCTKCLEPFSLIPGKKYVISAWVKEQNNFDATTYNNAYIRVSFNGSTNDKIVKGSGEIIDGWQKIEEEFTIQGSIDGVRIELNNGGGTGDVFFDDIRLFPFESNMVSYVYDQFTLKLVAELDANNYATYYIYDDEGKLTKVKKETTNGVKTVKEGRVNNVIQN